MKGLIPLFDVDQEQNIPTFFSVLLILFIVLLLGTIAVLAQKERGPHVAKWAILAFGFMAMAFDEAFQFHEQLVLPLQSLLGNENLGVFHFTWVIPGIALVLLLGVFYSRFLFQLPPRTRLFFIIAGALYLGGAIGFELIDGRYADLHGQETLAYSLLTTVEEGLEMAGLIVFIWALLMHISERYEELLVRFAKTQAKDASDRRPDQDTRISSTSSGLLRG